MAARGAVASEGRLHKAIVREEDFSVKGFRGRIAQHLAAEYLRQTSAAVIAAGAPGRLEGLTPRPHKRCWAGPSATEFAPKIPPEAGNFRGVFRGSILE